MLDTNQDRNVVRYTLQSFVGPHIRDIKISQRQKDAIQRLVYLSDDKFNGLCADIANEIHHRSGMKHNKEGPMYEKLTNLSEEKFRNLVVDTLLVYNYRNPGTEMLQMDDFLNSLEELIEKLKNQSISENFINKIKGMKLMSVFSEYNRYIERTTTTDPEIIKAIDRVVSSGVEAVCEQLLECLTHPCKFMEALDRTGMAGSGGYKFHRENILRLLNGNEDAGNEKAASY